MKFNEKTKRAVCLVLAMMIPIAIGIVSMFLS